MKNATDLDRHTLKHSHTYRSFQVKITILATLITLNSNNGWDNAVFRQKTPAKEGRGLIDQVAGVEGLEPPAPGFGDRCSTN